MPLFIPARNVRKTDPRCCETCALFEFDGEGIGFCLRPGGPEFDVCDKEYLYTVCDLWRSHLKNPIEKSEIER